MIVLVMGCKGCTPKKLLLLIFYICKKKSILMALTISSSQLGYLGSSVTITVGGTSTSPSRWANFLFYKATVGITTPFYSGAIAGDSLNPILDTYWNVTLPTNATYTFYAISLLPYDSTKQYSTNDWTFNPVDGKIYICKATNTGQSFANPSYWRQFNSNDYESVQSKTANVLATSFERNVEAIGVTNNTAFLGLSVKMRMSIDSSVQTIALNDQTGDFDFQNNPNGYGGINPYRGDYAQILFLTNTLADGTSYTYTPRTYSYKSALKYNIDVPRDGLYKLYLYMVAFFVTGSSYNIDDIVFDANSNSFYKSLVNYNTSAISVTASWVKITSLSDFSSGITYQSLNYYFIQDNNGKKLLYDLALGIKNSCPCSDSSKCGDDLNKKYIFVLQCIENACFARQLSKYDTAQCFLEKIPKNCAPYISIYK